MLLICSINVISLVVLYSCSQSHVNASEDNHEGVCSKDAEYFTTTQQKLKGLIQTLLDKAQEFPTTVEGVAEVLETRDQILHIQGTDRIDHLPRRKSLEEAVEVLNQWSETAYTVNGIQGVVVDEFTGQGLVATRDIKVNETVLELSTENVVSSQYGSGQFECLGSISELEDSEYPGFWKSANLSLLLLNEARNERGRFRAYIDALPATLVHPTYFDISDFELLQHSIAFESAAFAACEILAMYATLWLRLDEKTACARSLNLHHPNFPLNSFLWAYTITLTRNLDGSFDDDETNNVLLPLWDLANHDSQYNVETQNIQIEKKSGKYTTLAERDIKAGEPILMHYHSQLDPIEAFAIYGIVEMSGYALKIRLDPQSPLHAEQTRILDEAKDESEDWDDEMFLPDPEEFNGSRLLDQDDNPDTLRILVDLGSGKSGLEITPSVLARGWKFLLDQIDSRISDYPYSVEHLRAKRTDDSNEVRKTIYTQLIEELLILQRLKAYVEHVLRS